MSAALLNLKGVAAAVGAVEASLVLGIIVVSFKEGREVVGFLEGAIEDLLVGRPVPDGATAVGLKDGLAVDRVVGLTVGFEELVTEGLVDGIDVVSWTEGK